MSVDWVTVVAQVVNFLVLVYLLKRFLYGPITEAMQHREQRIAERMDEAESREQEAEEEAEAYRQQKRELDEKRENLEREAREAADRERRELIEQAREDVDAQRDQWLAGLKREQDAFLCQLRTLAADEIAQAARRLLDDLADASLEERMVHRFVKHLREADDEARAVLTKGRDHVAVVSAFALSDEAEDLIIDAVQEITDTEAQPQFEQDSGLVCGIELRLEGYKLGWTVDRYLDAVEQRIGDQLESAG